MSKRDVVCGKHGTTPITYACRHLVSGVGCGFHCSEDHTTQWPDAWCDGCEELRLAGGWTDELTIALVKILCTRCWEVARDSNERVPSLARGRAARLTDVEVEGLIAGASEHVTRAQDATEARWSFLAMPRWDFDAEARAITFSSPTRQLVADVRMVGSYSRKSSTFQWSWVLHEPDDPTIQGVDKLRTFGEVRGIEQLTTNSWGCEIVEGWEMVAIAGYLLGCDGVYRAPFDHLYWFMLLSNFREVT